MSADKTAPKSEGPQESEVPTKGKERRAVDGSYGVADVVYRINEQGIIYPITPSSLMGEYIDQFNSKSRKNLFGQVVEVTEMQSEAGAAGALHGALVGGSLSTTFTASQGLLLMIPNMYKIAGELLPCVIHVAARAIAGQALSIYGDHTDLMSVRATGFAILSSFDCQDAHDLAVVAQITALKTSIPFVHAMDGFRTSHEIKKVDIIDDKNLKELVLDGCEKEIERHRMRAVSPMHPNQRGTAQNPDVFMQMLETSNSHYNSIPATLRKVMKSLGDVTGRYMDLFEYSGPPDAKYVIVTMGSSYYVVKDLLDHWQKHDGDDVDHDADTNERVKRLSCGVLGVRLYNPWCQDSFMSFLPLDTVEKIAVLDRVKTAGTQGEPLFCEVATTLMMKQQLCKNPVQMAGGRYGLGSKDFDPMMVKAVYKNLFLPNDQMKRRFTVGIIDDVTHLSLPLPSHDPLSFKQSMNIFPPSCTQCVFWGFGSDGTVSGNKTTIKMIAEYSAKAEIQGYFEYDAKKAGGLTVSYLRFDPSGKHTINAPYVISDGCADFVACHNEAYIEAHKYHITKPLKRNGVLLLNMAAAGDEDLMNDDKKFQAHLKKYMSPKVLHDIVDKDIQFYIMDATGVANKFGLRGKINMLCVEAFFKLSGVLPFEHVVKDLKKQIAKTFSHKGQDVIDKNCQVVDALALDPKIIRRVDLNLPKDLWKKTLLNQAAAYNLGDRSVVDIEDMGKSKYVKDIVDPVLKFEGNQIPVSKFIENDMLGGIVPAGTTKYEKRNPNPTNKLPQWNPSNCTQCNKCVFICPHGVIRPYLVSNEDIQNLPHPELVESVKAKGGGAKATTNKRYILQVSNMDCTGCNACADVCPEMPKALEMEGEISLDKDMMRKLAENWNAIQRLPECGHLLDDVTNVRGSMFQPSMVEFSGACSGCGETPYMKTLTQLFGTRLVIANATGCTSIWGGSFPTNPYSTNQKGQGPAWANSLFEDNAEYGFGMMKARTQRRQRLVTLVREVLKCFEEYYETNPVDSSKEVPEGSSDPAKLCKLLQKWYDTKDQKSNATVKLYEEIEPLLKLEIANKELPKDIMAFLRQIYYERDMFIKISQWIVGGDGWALDIGFGGIDHVVAGQENDCNFLIMDTEMYSNTGGQQSKSTPMGASVKFALAGKMQKKKDIREMLLTYDHVYVASCSLANMTQCLNAMMEADAWDGPSFIICYAPCIEFGIRPNGLNDLWYELNLAVDSGHWPLYRYNPALALKGENPFSLDSKKLKVSISEFLSKEGRFINLQKNQPKLAEQLTSEMNRDIMLRMDKYKQRASASSYMAYLGLDAGKGSSSEGDTIYVLYGSETGCAERLSREFYKELSANVANGLYSRTIEGEGEPQIVKTAEVKYEVLDGVELEDLQNATLVILFISTCGQGAFPENSKSFWSTLQSTKADASVLGNLNYTVFGLGDTSYYFFCETAKLMDKHFEGLGAKRVNETAYGDDSEDGGYMMAFENMVNEPKWWNNMNFLGDQCVAARSSGGGQLELLACDLLYSDKVFLEEGEEADLLDQYMINNFELQKIIVNSNERTTPEEYATKEKRDFRHISFRCDNLPYELGDSLTIMPSNCRDRVDNFLKILNSKDYESRTVVRLVKKDAKEEAPPAKDGEDGESKVKTVTAVSDTVFPEGEITVGGLLTKVFDIFGKPTKKFMKQLLIAADATMCGTLLADDAGGAGSSDGEGEKSKVAVGFPEEPELKKELETLVAINANFSKPVEERSETTFEKLICDYSYSIADVFLLFPHVTRALPLPVVLSLVPNIVVRDYSIASAPSYHGTNIELCVLIDEWVGVDVRDGKSALDRCGLCTDYLRNLERFANVYAKIKPGSMDPPKVSNNVICVGIGSGLAPHLCYLYDRIAAAERGDKDIGKFLLYFGNRTTEGEFLYREFLEALPGKYSWFKLQTAFSRDDPKKKIYVQHLLERDPEATPMMAPDGDALLYLCGNRGLPKGVQKAITGHFQTIGKKTPDEAKAIMENLFVKGRAQQEVW